MTHPIGAENRTIMILFLVVLLGLITPIRHTVFSHLPREIVAVLQGRTPVARVLVPGTGLNRTLNSDAFRMRQALIKNGVKTYRISDPLRSHVSFFQRIVESSYPILPTPNAKYALVSTQEAIERRCKLIQQSQEVRLVYCP